MTEQASTGLFITFEGGEGAGKSTQIQRVATWFRLQGREVLVTFEPGATDLGAHLRQLIQFGPEDVDPRTEALLYAADRAYHVATVVRPALARGTVVLGDRYIDSSVAYQGAARALGTDEIRALSAWATQDLDPDLTFLLDLPPEVGARRGQDAPDRIEREPTDFHEHVRREFLHLAEQHPGRMVVIDGVGTPDQVFSEIRGVLEERFNATPVPADRAEVDADGADAEDVDPDRADRGRVEREWADPVGADGVDPEAVDTEGAYSDGDVPDPAAANSASRAAPGVDLQEQQATLWGDVSSGTLV